MKTNRVSSSEYKQSIGNAREVESGYKEVIDDKYRAIVRPGKLRDNGQ